VGGRENQRKEYEMEQDKTTVFLDFETNGFQDSSVLSVAAIKDNSLSL